MDRLRKAIVSKLRRCKLVRNGLRGALGGVLRVTWAPSGRSWEALGAILGALGTFLDCFGRSWERTFEVFRLQKKTLELQVPNLDELVTIWARFWDDFVRI